MLHWARAFKKAFASSGVTKNGAQVVLTSTSTYTKIPNWVARSGFPATLIENDGIRVPVGQLVTYAAFVQFVGSSNGSTVTLRGRLLNGATVLEERSINSVGATSSTFVGGSFIGTGELVTMEAWANSLASSRDQIAATTYFTLTV